MSGSVYFNANTTPADGSLDKAAITANGTTAEREFTGQNSLGTVCEFAGWEVSGSAPNALPAGTSVQLQRKIDGDDSDSWMTMATIDMTTSRLTQVFPNGTYRAVVSGFTVNFKVLLQGV